MLPIITALLPAQLGNDVGRFLPAKIGRTMVSTGPLDDGQFDPWVGFTLLCGYAVVVLVVAGSMLVRRDA